MTRSKVLMGRYTLAPRTAVLAMVAVLAGFSAYAQNVPVDQEGANRGNLATGALLFGGSEPNDPFRCLVGLRGSPAPPCPEVPTMEGIISPRTLPLIAGQPRKVPANQYGLDFYTDNLPRLSITHSGQIGVGTQSPAFSIDIQRTGDVQVALRSLDAGGKEWSLQSSGTVSQASVGTFQIIDRDQNVQRLGIDSQGMVTVKSLQITGGSDLAEPFLTSGRLPAGSLVVIDASQPGRLLPSTRAYDRKVAGVISGAHNIKPGLSLEQLDAGEGKQEVALSGRVYVLANASNGPIRPGDLLTSSSEIGHAMRAANLRKAQGSTIGKALTPLDNGEGLVLILVSLQ